MFVVLKVHYYKDQAENLVQNWNKMPVFNSMVGQLGWIHLLLKIFGQKITHKLQIVVN